MKCKICGLCESQVDKGFKLDSIIDITKVEISGDYCAYDIWYYANEEVFFSLSIEELETDDRLLNVINHLDNYLKDNEKYNLPFKFKYEIDLI